MSDRKLPSVQDRQAPAASDDEVGRRLAVLRAEAARDEERIIPYVCAVTGGRFFARFKREAPKSRFCIAAIEKGAAPEKGAGLLTRLFAKRQPPERRDYAAKEFNRTGWHCPYCDARGSVYCDECDQNVCEGRTRKMPNGERLFVCHEACGATGGIVASDTTRGVSSGPGLPGRTDAPALEGPRKALPGVAKQLPPPKR